MAAPRRHEVAKGGPMNWNEGLHSRLRGGLNRLVQSTKGYSKSPGNAGGLHRSVAAGQRANLIPDNCQQYRHMLENYIDVIDASERVFPM